MIESDGGLNLLRSDSYFSLLAVIHFLVDMLGVFAALINSLLGFFLRFKILLALGFAKFPLYLQNEQF